MGSRFRGCVVLVITISNVSELAEVSDYAAEVSAVGPGGMASRRVLWSGTIKGHRRARGWPALLELLAKATKAPAGGRRLRGKPRRVVADPRADR